MKKIFSLLLVAIFTISVYAQRYMYVTKTDGSVTEFAISAIDSIHFGIKTDEPPIEHNPEYVDLGLPSGTLWATCNVGADSPEDYGDYFAWGETEPKSNYDWSNEGDYKWGVYNESDVNYGMTKYNVINGNTILEAIDDAATANWGRDWRTPTYAHLNELRTECTWTWTTDYNSTGVAGYIVASKVEGNTNSIFLPAAGYRDGSNLEEAGLYAYYWSSSLDENGSEDAWALCFDVEYYDWCNVGRYGGLPVRPVYGSPDDYIESTMSCTEFVNSDVYQNIADGETTEEEFTVRGIVKEIEQIDTGLYGNAVFYITDGTSDVYCYYIYAGVDSAKFVSAKQLVVGDIVTVKSKLTNYNGTKELKRGYIVRTSNTFDPSSVDTSTKPVTVAEVLAMDIANGTTTDGTFQITGTISDITTEFNTQYGNATFTITDNSTTEGLLIYRAKYLDDQKWIEGNPQIQVGDEVTVVGSIKNYNGLIEFVNCYILEHKQ